MRMFLLAGVISMAATAVQAESSFTVVGATNRTTGSVEQITCPTCAPLKTKKIEKTEITLKPGTQKVEIREVNGEKKVFRTEAWLGGSPVTHVSKVIMDLGEKESGASTTADVPPVMIDSSTTSAVNADMTGKTMPAEPAQQTKTFNAKDLQLRLN